MVAVRDGGRSRLLLRGREPLTTLQSTRRKALLASRSCGRRARPSAYARRPLASRFSMPSDAEKGDAREDRLQGPMRPLHREREHVRKQMLKEARDKCDETRGAYIACAKGVRAPARREGKERALKQRCSVRSQIALGACPSCAAPCSRNSTRASASSAPNPHEPPWSAASSPVTRSVCGVAAPRRRSSSVASRSISGGSSQRLPSRQTCGPLTCW